MREDGERRGAGAGNSMGRRYRKHDHGALLIADQAAEHVTALERGRILADHAKAQLRCRRLHTERTMGVGDS